MAAQRHSPETRSELAGWRFWDVESVFHEEIGGAPALGNEHLSADIDKTHLMLKQPIWHQAVAVTDGDKSVQGRVEVGRIAQGLVGKIGQTLGNTVIRPEGRACHLGPWRGSPQGIWAHCW
jgi:hypothetical protein